MKKLRIPQTNEGQEATFIKGGTTSTEQATTPASEILSTDLTEGQEGNNPDGPKPGDPYYKQHLRESMGRVFNLEEVSKKVEEMNGKKQYLNRLAEDKQALTLFQLQRTDSDEEEEVEADWNGCSLDIRDKQGNRYTLTNKRVIALVVAFLFDTFSIKEDELKKQILELAQNF
ncbi:hypothetical protein [Chitinophaga sp. Ak27]|uniref:hypothetical protein n=1 Tax=Chitinophaga sp. Ak27 TaxID=2726116 RepID=UPI00145C9F0C|nr:hypothetical protein [Chitinophaga sp. Ak27]NLU94890.1 hypothetical protein [Chitinophaga sp. Ak27]